MLDNFKFCKFYLVFILLYFANAQIKNGENVEFEDKPPYVVLLSIYAKNIHTNTIHTNTMYSGGVILNEFWVVTAAHCLQYNLNSFMRYDIDDEIEVKAGDIRTEGRLFAHAMQKRKAGFWIHHPEYRFSAADVRCDI